MVTTQSVVLNTEVLGEGDPLLFFHGWGHSIARARPFGELLSNRAQVHLIDLPGFGASAPPDGIWSTFDYADRMAAYMDEMGIMKADIAGHSFGAKIALCMAVRHPHRVRRLILMASSGFRRLIPKKDRARAKVIKWVGRGVKVVDSLFSTQFYAGRFIPRFASSDYQAAGPMRAILVKTLSDDLTRQLSSVSCPTLLLWGENDRATPPAIAHHLHKNIVGSQLIFHPNKGHLLYDDVGGHLCARHILSFLEGRLS
jgi:pimeloyl-ACP methyl ester carboxylesterase